VRNLNGTLITNNRITAHTTSRAITSASDVCTHVKKVKVAHTRLSGDVSHKPGGRLPLLSARPAVTPATLERAATNNFAAW